MAVGRAPGAGGCTPGGEGCGGGGGGVAGGGAGGVCGAEGPPRRLSCDAFFRSWVKAVVITGFGVGVVDLGVFIAHTKQAYQTR